MSVYREYIYLFYILFNLIAAIFFSLSPIFYAKQMMP